MSEHDRHLHHKANSRGSGHALLDKFFRADDRMR